MTPRKCEYRKTSGSDWHSGEWVGLSHRSLLIIEQDWLMEILLRHLYLLFVQIGKAVKLR